MAKFDMAQFLSDAGVNFDTGSRKQVEYIPIDRIAPDPDNFYELSAIDDLAENIALFGLQQPIVLRPMPEDNSRYIIVSGHRRHAAIQKLIQEDGRDDLREVMCIVERGEENPKLNELKLIYANASTRIISSAEQAKQAERVEKLLYELKEEGVEFPGRMRDHVAAACQMSTGKLARLKVIREGLNDFWVPLWEAGKIKEAVAYELARIPKDRQYLIYTRFGQSDKRISELSSYAVSEYNNRFRRIDEITCGKRKSVCSNADGMRKKALEVPVYSCCECTKCCAECHSIASCKHVCIMLRDKQQAARREKEERDIREKREAAERERPDIEYIRGVYSRFGAAMEAKGLTLGQVASKAGLPYEAHKIEGMIDGTVAIASNDRLPFSYGFFLSDAKAICRTADLLGCSIDYLLGRAEKCVNVDTWRTGDPEEPGYYAVFVAEGLLDVLVLEWTEQGWKDTEIDSYDIEIDGEILGWLRLPDKFPDSETEE